MKAAELGALKAEEQSSKSKLEQKLAARRQKKTEEMRKREERQLKEKEARDAQRLQVWETSVMHSTVHTTYQRIRKIVSWPDVLHSATMRIPV